MTPEQIIQELERYRSELTGIMARFDTNRNSCDILEEDDHRYRTFILEIIAFLNDTIGNDNEYSPLVQSKFDEGLSNFYESPSYESVGNIVIIINSLVTRLKRTPEFYIKKEEPMKPSEPEKSELKPPDKITLKWLWEHVPYHIWGVFLGLLISAFTFGVTVADTKLYKSAINLLTPNSNTNKNVPPTTDKIKN